MIKFAGVAVVALTLAQTLQAVPITGGIQFVGGATLDQPAAASATAVTSWINTTVQYVTPGSSFSSVTPVPGAAVTFASGTWNFLTPATFIGSVQVASIANFWAVDGFTFDLWTSSVSTRGPSGVLVTGTGVVSGNGYTPTTLSWSFSTQDPGLGSPAIYSFSASTSPVPDGGSTVMLLGIALSGVALLRKKLTA